MTLPAESVTVASRGTVVTAVLWAAASEAPDAAPDAACEAPEATAWEALATAEVRMGMAARGEPLADWATPEHWPAAHWTAWPASSAEQAWAEQSRTP